MATHTSSRTGLTLDDADPDDRKIIDRQRDAARKSGKEGGDRSGLDQDRADLLAAFDEGAAAPSKDPAAAPSAPSGSDSGRGGKAKGKPSGGRSGFLRPGLRPPRTLSTRDSAGFALGMVLYALTVSYIRYGKAGPRGWMAAKFLNKPLQGDDLKAGGKASEHPKSGRGPNGEQPAEGHMDPNVPIA